MKTQEAIDLAGSTKDLADLLGITSGAVSQWGEDLPQPRVFQLMVIKPEWFKNGNGKHLETPPPRGSVRRDRRTGPVDRRVSPRSVAERRAIEEKKEGKA